MKSPFELHITSRKDAARTARSIGATHLVSLLDPGVRAHRPGCVARENHLWLVCMDIEDAEAPHAPRLDQVERLLRFGSRIPSGAKVVVHCEAGICRSTAAAFLLLVQAMGTEKAEEAIDIVRQTRDGAIPNLLIVSHGDHLFGTGGRLADLADRLGAEMGARLLAAEDRTEF